MGKSPFCNEPRDDSDTYMTTGVIPRTVSPKHGSADSVALRRPQQLCGGHVCMTLPPRGTGTRATTAKPDEMHVRSA